MVKMHAPSLHAFIVMWVCVATIGVVRFSCAASVAHFLFLRRSLWKKKSQRSTRPKTPAHFCPRLWKSAVCLKRVLTPKEKSFFWSTTRLLRTFSGRYATRHTPTADQNKTKRAENFKIHCPFIFGSIIPNERAVFLANGDEHGGFLASVACVVGRMDREIHLPRDRIEYHSVAAVVLARHRL